MKLRVIKGVAMILLCCTALFFTGCRRKPFMLDGPGMEYEPQWEEFPLIRRDSYPQYHFRLSVSQAEDAPILTGEYTDEEGNLHLIETGIELSAETLWQLRWMDPEQLETINQEFYVPNLPASIDQSRISFTLTLSDGSVEVKLMVESLASEIYELLSPYFKS